MLVFFFFFANLDCMFGCFSNCCGNDTSEKEEEFKLEFLNNNFTALGGEKTSINTDTKYKLVFSCYNDNNYYCGQFNFTDEAILHLDGNIKKISELKCEVAEKTLKEKITGNNRTILVLSFFPKEKEDESPKKETMKIEVFSVLFAESGFYLNSAGKSAMLAKFSYLGEENIVEKRINKRLSSFKEEIEKQKKTLVVV